MLSFRLKKQTSENVANTTFKVINKKNLHSENLNHKFNKSQLINFCNCRIPASNLIVVICYLCSLYSPVYLERFSNTCKSFNRRTSIYWSLETHESTEAAIEGVLHFSKELYYRLSSWQCDYNHRKMQVKKLNFSKVADL